MPRRSDFAGSWYPGSDRECREVIEGFLSDANPCASDSGIPLGGIVPHAGWFYSGKIACNVIKCLRDGEPDTVILFGRHLHPQAENYIMREGVWSTPLGELEIDKELGERLLDEFSFQVETETRYEPDNTIELQLPFIKYFFPSSKILPMGVPPRESSLQIGRRTVQLSREMGRKIRIIGSTDLTHYGYNYGFTPEGIGEEAVQWVKNVNDRKVINLMLSMEAEDVIYTGIREASACCSGAAGTAISAIKELGAKRAQELMYYTSYDVRPDSSFVGYVGIVFYG